MKRKHPLTLVTRDNASPQALQAMQEHQAQGHGMTNMKHTILNNVPMFRAVNDVMETVNVQLAGKIPPRAMLFFHYAIASGNGCMVCGTVFKKMVMELGIEDFASFAFTDEERDLIDFANAFVRDANHIPNEIYERLQARYDDETMTVLVLNAVYTHASNLFNNITGVELDEHLKPYYHGEFDAEC